MDSGSEHFSFSGPSHLNNIDWNNAHHRRSVAACLVGGVYVLESDRQARRKGSQCLAPPWWEFFHFKLIHQLVDDDDNSIFGAIFEYNPPPYAYHRTIDRSPRYVIAFRGTLMKRDSVARDLDLDIDVIRNGLHQTTRFAIAIKAVRDVVFAVRGSNVWLTGHSLGAAMAMLAGKTMAKTGYSLEAFLFNPPFVSPPIEIIKDKKVRHGLRFAGTVIKAGLAFAAATNGNNNNSRNGNGYEDSFAAISGWIPCLFVNQKDPICAEYIGYFEHRRKLENIGAGAIARLTSQHSLANLFMSAVGMKGVETSEPLHLLPSANLTVNLNPPPDIMQAHGLYQWWRPDLNLRCSVYKY
ncbi:GDSL esterase/lipase At4g10955-like [Durio zibethinus]|uniref:GDSL esterase/lipase At4g10955-like n=1 Tax=Durio zibethinus TaxID=66656 RepID=A0A6P5WWP0_DURZI|nr:GDSL esterase/lipase At4g10955-like [Durio zibethinus]